ncbi:hypothetical protein JCM6882_002922 [Rhodosporidiobolus microsporus]
MLPLARRAQTPLRYSSYLRTQLSSARAASTLTSPFAPPPTPSPTPELSPALSTLKPDDRKVAYLWYNLIFPIRVGIWDVRYLLSRLQQQDLLARIRDLVPKDAEYDVRVECVEPRAKDGGAFVQVSFNVPEKVKQALENAAEEGELDEAGQQKKAKEIEAKIAKIIEKEAIDALFRSGFRPWFALHRPSKTFLVKGRPWMEDMNRFPSREIQVQFEGPDLPQEELYEVFRPYGKIHDIVPGSKSARIIFSSTRSATSARNCLHAAKVSPSSAGENGPTTILRILYAERHHSNYVKDWITSHPRITIPALVALIGTVSYAVFDPIREFFVKSRVEGTFDADQWVIVRWLKKETLGRLGLTGQRAGALGNATATGIEKEREEAKEQLEGWLRDVPDTFIVVTGPRGSGKTALVDEVLADGKNILTIDCDQLLKNARTDTKLVTSLADATGYWPQFVLASSLNNMIDLAAVGLIGQKAGFASSLDVQLKAILEVTSSALSSIAAASRARSAALQASTSSRHDTAHSRDQIASQLRTDGVRDGRLDTVAGTGVMAELGGGIENPAAGLGKEVGEGEKVKIVGPQSAELVKDIAATDAAAASTPAEEPREGELHAPLTERLPVVVIKGFSGKGEHRQELLYDVLSEWAAVLVEHQVAHVVFTSDASTVTKPLAKALPSRPFNMITLTDASPESALQYVAAKYCGLGATLPTEAYPLIAQLGGRQTDLELLVQKFRAGQSIEEAIDGMLDREATGLRKNLFGDDEEEAKALKWTRDQAWALVQGLSDKGELKYAETLLTTFGGDDSALRALESASLISVHHVNGRPSTIRPGKPVYRSAFERLIADAPFRASIKFRSVSAGLSGASGEVKSAQAELIELAKLFTAEKGKWAFGGGSAVPPEIETRVGQLLAQMRAAQQKSEALGKEKARLLAVLKEAE